MLFQGGRGHCGRASAGRGREDLVAPHACARFYSLAARLKFSTSSKISGRTLKSQVQMLCCGIVKCRT